MLKLCNRIRYIATAIKGSGKKSNEALPDIHRVTARVKRWLMGAYQGSFEADHLQAYLDEFAFRFNRHKSAHQGRLFYRLMEPCVAMPLVSFRELVANPKPKDAGQEFAVPVEFRNKAPASPDIVGAFTPMERLITAFS